MPRLRRMDGLRGVLAIYVMLGHALPFTTLPPWLTAPFHHGEAAVDLFFCLSGLVIMNSLEHHRTAAPFLRARARRLMPVYVTVLALGTLALLAGDPLPSMPWASPAARDFWAAGLPPHPLAHLLAHLTLIQGLIPQGLLPYAYITLLGPAWSLSAEAQFYVLIAFIGPARPRFVLCLLLGLGLLWALAPAGGTLAMSRAFLPSAAVYFALGVASIAVGRGDSPRQLVICLIAALITALVLGGGSGKILIPLAWVAILYLQTIRLGAVLESRLLLFLGAISYPLYLVNEPAQRLLALLIAPHIAPESGALFTLLWLPLAIAVPIAVAWLLHLTVEPSLTRTARPAPGPLPSAPIRPI